VFGVFYYTNDQMWTHGYRKKTVLGFYQKNGPKVYGGIKQMFLVLGNILIHKSNKVKAALSNHHPRPRLVFLPPTTRSPELDLIEVKGGYGCNDKPLKTPPFKMNMI
jgi:hypothetical protein